MTRWLHASRRPETESIPPKAQIRDYRTDDLGLIPRLWEQTHETETNGAALAVDEAVGLLSDEQAIALVAEPEGANVSQRGDPARRTLSPRNVETLKR